MNTSTITNLSKVFCLVGGILLGISLFVPLWRIELDAPQYPEGLALTIYPNKLGGDVEIINGLNHYIGMQTLHAENFIEFTVLPYCIGFFSLLFLMTGLIGRKRLLYGAFALFVVFGVVAIADFWRWEYNYGHELDPNAAIKVPGMSYQPPLIGFKQLLNFGAYSIPDTGGWLFIGCGVLLLLAVLMESGALKRWIKPSKVHLITGGLFTVLLVQACSPTNGPEAIRLNIDQCDHCKMPIAEAAFAAELMTEKGRVYKFDDLSCLVRYRKANTLVVFRSCWVASQEPPHALIDAETAFYVSSPAWNSPMAGNIAAFAQRENAAAAAQKHQSAVIDWSIVLQQ
jgi:copper chaperone NosL